MRRSSNQAGFTLVELLVSTGTGLFVLAAAVTLASDHSRVLGRSTTRLDMHQSARLAAELIAQDIRHAGVGIGYRADNSFAGIRRGEFQLAGGAPMDADDREIVLNSGRLLTDDLVIRQAVGSMRSIAQFGNGTGQICAGGDFETDDIVVLVTREGLHAQTVRLTAIDDAICTDGSCVNGCQDFTFVSDASYTADPAIADANFTGGEMAGEYQEVAYFVYPNAEGRGVLQRAEISGTTQCQAADASCGGTVAENVETLQIAVWQWDDGAQVWTDVTTAPSIPDRSRLRVDVELVVRAAYVDDRSGLQAAQQLELAATCVPAPCGTEQDRVQRWTLRSSVEIRNSGRMQIR